MKAPRPSGMDGRPDRDGLGALLSQQPLNTLEAVVQRKARCWLARPPSSTGGVARIIADYSERAALAGSRPGTAVAASHVVALLRNHASMVCDVAAELGKPEIVTDELVSGVLLWSPGVTDMGFMTVQDGRIVVRHAPRSVLKEVAGRLCVHLARSMTGRPLRVGGAAAVAAWTRHATRWRGEQAAELLGGDVELSDDEVHAFAEPATEDDPAAVPPDLVEAGVVALANLVKADRHISEHELDHVEEVLASYGTSHAAAARVRAEMSSRKATEVDLSGFTQVPDEAIALMVDLVSLAKRDGQIRPSERAYIQQVGRQIGYGDEDVAALLGR